MAASNSTMNAIEEIKYISKIIETGDISLITETGITPDYFLANKKEFKYIYDHVNQYNVVPDKVNFLAQFDNFTVIEVRDTKDSIINSLCEAKTTRDLSVKFNQLRDALMNGDVERALEIDKMQVESSQQTYLKNVPDILSKDEAESRYNEYIDKMSRLDDFYIPTGFSELDKAWGGGWDSNEEFATIVARPGVGKSWILDNAVVAASNKGKRVGLFSGEMSKNKVASRIDTFRSHISNSAISHGRRDVQNDYKKYIDNIDSSNHGPIFVATIKDDFAGRTPTIKDFQNFIEKYNIDIFFLDQQSLMDDIGHTKNPIDKAGNIAQELKLLQTNCKIPVITVCQQNRGGQQDKDTGEIEYDVSRIANNDKIGQYSTIVIFLEYDKDTKILKVVPAKVRDGGGKTEKYAWDIDKGIFNHIEIEEGETSAFDGGEALPDEFGDNVSHGELIF